MSLSIKEVFYGLLKPAGKLISSLIHVSDFFSLLPSSRVMLLLKGTLDSLLERSNCGSITYFIDRCRVCCMAIELWNELNAVVEPAAACRFRMVERDAVFPIARRTFGEIEPTRLRGRRP